MLTAEGPVNQRSSSRNEPGLDQENQRGLEHKDKKSENQTACRSRRPFEMWSVGMEGDDFRFYYARKIYQILSRGMVCSTVGFFKRSSDYLRGKEFG